MKRLSILLALAGIAAIAVLLVRYDAAQVIGAALSVGWQGFLLLVAWQLGLFVLLGAAWSRVLPGPFLGLLVWGRMVRDAATTCLPFSPVGGYVVGARAVTLHGVPWPTAAASTVVDVTTEIVAQLVFAVFGLLVLVLDRPDSGIAVPLAIGVGLALASTLVALAQRARIGRGIRGLGERLLGDWFRAQGGLDRLQQELTRLYGSPSRLLQGVGLHLCGWFITGIGTWISLNLLGHPTDLLGVLALEALLDALVAAAFIVPGAAGVQEAGYIGLGAVFGVPPDLALGVSLLRRARDLALGLPILAAWQWREVRRLRA